MQQWRPENRPLTFDEMSMEQSKSFVKALQELKNLRPQLYSAAEYCEKSYLHNDQKQMVLENLKDYAVRALVNAVDHLGTVAYKLSDLVEQQTLDVSNAELKISCLNQRILTCQMYTDKEGLRQQQIMISSPKHHKHYILPNSVTLKADTNNLSQAEAKHRPYPPGTPAPKTLSWLLASDSTNSGTSGSPNATLGTVDMKSSKIPTEPFRLRDPKDDAASLLPRSSSGTSTLKPVGVKDTIEVPKPMSAFRSFDNPGSRALIKAPVRSKSMLSMFFAKTKAPKPKPKTVVYNYAR